MPILNRQDASEVARRIKEIFQANGTDERAHAIRSLFVEVLDFQHVFELKIDLNTRSANVDLPNDARILARMDDTHIVYVDLSQAETDTNRVRQREAAEAARLISDQLGGDVLLVFTNRSRDEDRDCDQLHFIYPSLKGARTVLRRMIVEDGLPYRTVAQQISNIYSKWVEADKCNIHGVLEAAFDVEAVTHEFFREYKRIFGLAMNLVIGFGPNEEAEKNEYVQVLFNRLMFVYFVSRKGWLTFENDNDYLNALWKNYQADPDQDNFYRSRLELLFFSGLNNPMSRNLMISNPTLHSLIGNVPFLNGGLFEKSTLEKELERQSEIQVPDKAIEPILKELFDRFNFTVMESTPLDIEVAVDPEMLGKVFEELINERSESGAYYTPRAVVSFMCREALKGYLASCDTGLTDGAIARFVDEHDTSGIPLESAASISNSLSEIKVIDPACGSGAYLLGMMHELVELQSTLYSDKLKSDAESLYELKLRVIERNLYGVDIEQFAVNVAMLRLWLSLTIDYDGTEPQALPNLTYRIVCGDSLLGPDPNEFSFDRDQIAKSDLASLKSKYMTETNGNAKNALRIKIDQIKNRLKKSRGDARVDDGSVDWFIDFAEVFGSRGGFDVVVANPPYVRQEKIDKDVKASLRKQYSKSTVARSDLFCYFYVRALELLRQGGMHVFVCSNSWLDVGYGAKLQEYLLRNSHVQVIYESLVERQFSTAQINTIISLIQKVQGDDEHQTRFVSLRDEFEVALHESEKRREISMSGAELWESALGDGEINSYRKFVGDKWGAKYLRAPNIYRTVLEKGRDKLVRLGDVADVKFGIKTGADGFFYLTDDEVDEWGIEEEFLQPVMTSPQESRKLAIDASDLPRKLFMCHEDKENLGGGYGCTRIYSAR